MPEYKYYGLFKFDEDGVSVSFPDLQGCLTCGDDLKEALDMATDALGGYLLLSEIENDPIPRPRQISELNITDGMKAFLIEVDTDKLANELK